MHEKLKTLLEIIVLRFTSFFFWHLHCFKGRSFLLSLSRKERSENCCRKSEREKRAGESVQSIEKNVGNCDWPFSMRICLLMPDRRGRGEKEREKASAKEKKEIRRQQQLFCIDLSPKSDRLYYPWWRMQSWWGLDQCLGIYSSSRDLCPLFLRRKWKWILLGAEPWAGVARCPGLALSSDTPTPTDLPPATPIRTHTEEGIPGSSGRVRKDTNAFRFLCE